MNKSILLIAADPHNEANQTPGGQSSASKALVDKANSLGIKVVVIDTYQSHMENISLKKRLQKAMLRFKQLNAALKLEKFDSGIIFSAAGLSFIEKSLLALRMKLSKIPTTMCMRDGNFRIQNDNSYLWRSLARIFLKIPTRHIVQGASWKEHFISLGVPSKKIEIARNWPREYVQLQTTPKSANQVINFVFAGWVVKQKGIKELLEAVSNSEIIRTSIIHIIGDGAYMPTAKNYVEEHQLKNIHFYGNKAHKDTIEIISRSDVLVLPSYAEGFPNVIVEAMYSGLPIIATDVGAISDSVKTKKNGFLIEPKNTKSLQNAMEQFILNPELVKIYSEETIKIARIQHNADFNCDVMLGRIKNYR